MDLNNSTIYASHEPKQLDLNDPNLRDAVGLLIAHEDALCRGNEDAADELLADLEPHLRRLNWAQNEWLRGLSGDLLMLSDEETFENNPYASEEYSRLTAVAFSESDAEFVLSLLRMKQNSMPARDVAYGRSRAYSLIGFYDVSKVFMQHAIRLGSGGSGLAGIGAGLIIALTRIGIPKEDAKLYAEGVRRGNTLVIVNTRDDRTGKAQDILNKHGAIDIKERNASDQTTDHADREWIAPIVEKEFQVGKRQVQRNGVPLHTYVTESLIGETVTLREEQLAVNRDATNPSEIAEVPVVAKTARVVEEVVVGKSATDMTETVHETVSRANI